MYDRVYKEREAITSIVWGGHEEKSDMIFVTGLRNQSSQEDSLSRHKWGFTLWFSCKELQEPWYSSSPHPILITIDFAIVTVLPSSKW